MNRGFSQRGDGQGGVPVQGGLQRPLRFQTVVSGFSVTVEISMGWMDGWKEIKKILSLSLNAHPGTFIPRNLNPQMVP